MHYNVLRERIRARRIPQRYTHKTLAPSFPPQGEIPIEISGSFS